MDRRRSVFILLAIFLMNNLYSADFSWTAEEIKELQAVSQKWKGQWSEEELLRVLKNSRVFKREQLKRLEQRNLVIRYLEKIKDDERLQVGSGSVGLGLLFFLFRSQIHPSADIPLRYLRSRLAYERQMMANYPSEWPEKTEALRLSKIQSMMDSSELNKSESSLAKDGNRAFREAFNGFKNQEARLKLFESRFRMAYQEKSKILWRRIDGVVIGKDLSEKKWAQELYRHRPLHEAGTTFEIFQGQMSEQLREGKNPTQGSARYLQLWREYQLEHDFWNRLRKDAQKKFGSRADEFISRLEISGLRGLGDLRTEVYNQTFGSSIEMARHKKLSLKETQAVLQKKASQDKNFRLLNNRLTKFERFAVERTLKRISLVERSELARQNLRLGEFRGGMRSLVDYLGHWGSRAEIRSQLKKWLHIFDSSLPEDKWESHQSKLADDDDYRSSLPGLSAKKKKIDRRCQKKLRDLSKKSGIGLLALGAIAIGVAMQREDPDDLLDQEHISHREQLSKSGLEADWVDSQTLKHDSISSLKSQIYDSFFGGGNSNSLSFNQSRFLKGEEPIEFYLGPESVSDANPETGLGQVAYVLLSKGKPENGLLLRFQLKASEALNEDLANSMGIPPQFVPRRVDWELSEMVALDGSPIVQEVLGLDSEGSFDFKNFKIDRAAFLFH